MVRQLVGGAYYASPSIQIRICDDMDLIIGDTAQALFSQVPGLVKVHVFMDLIIGYTAEALVFQVPGLVKVCVFMPLCVIWVMAAATGTG